MSVFQDFWQALYIREVLHKRGYTSSHHKIASKAVLSIELCCLLYAFLFFKSTDICLYMLCW